MNVDDHGFGGGDGNYNSGVAMDRRRGSGRSSNWDSCSRNDGSNGIRRNDGNNHNYAQTVSSDCTHARDNINYHNNGQYSSSGSGRDSINNNSNNNCRRSNNNDIPMKVARAAKHRAKQELPGPAGAYFRLQKQKSATTTTRHPQQQQDAKMKMAVVVSLSENSTLMNSDSNTAQNIDMEIGGRRTEGIIKQQPRILKTEQLQPITEAVDDIIDSPPSPNNNSGSTQFRTKKQQQQLLFHDYSSDLHECNAWNGMCTALDRIVPPLNYALPFYREGIKNGKCSPSSSSSSSVTAYYMNILRNNIPDNYALIYEIHAGKYDVCHCFDSPESGTGGGSVKGGGAAVVHNDDLRIPLLVGYVASVQCHAHSDWTALLVDEMHSTKGSSGGGGSSSNASNNSSRGILCWLEERLVKQNPNWIRPGAVWMLDGAKLALFASACEEEENVEEEEDDDNGNAATYATGTDTSPSTDNARRRGGNNNIDRMILTGESSLIYAWTPEEATSAFTDEEFVTLTERRFNLVLPKEVDDGLVRVREDGSCSYTNDDLRKNSMVEAKDVGTICNTVVAVGKPRDTTTTQPAPPANDLSTHSKESSAGRCDTSGTSASHQLVGGGDEELLMLMQLSRQDVAQCEDRRQGTDFNEAHDNLGQIQIAPAVEPPPLPSPAAISNATLLPRPTIHGRARPVTSESITSTPPKHDDLDDGRSLNRSQNNNLLGVQEVVEDTVLEESNRARRPALRLNNSFDGGKFDENNDKSTEIVQTPSTQQRSIAQLPTCTGNDSFDDMLDEEFAVTTCNTTVSDADSTTKVKKPSQHSFANETNSYMNCLASAVDTNREASLLFDSLDGDDMDCLSEEDD